MKIAEKTHELLLAENAQLRQRLAVYEEQANILDTPMNGIEGFTKPFEAPIWVTNLKAQRLRMSRKNEIFGDDGKIIETMTAFEDFNERIQVQESILKESKILNAVIENTETQLVYLDPEFNFIWVNSVYAKGCRLPVGDFIGRNHFELFPHEENEAIFRKVRDTGEPILFKAKPFAHPDRPEQGVTYWDWMLTPITDWSDEVTGLVLSLTDVTEMVRTEETLRETRDYLENLINYANAPIIVWDSELRITRFNRAFERLTGYNAEYVLGRSLKILFPEDRKKESMEIIGRTASGEYWEVVEIPILHRDGNVRIVLWNSANINDETGKVVATIAQGQDITERKQMEENLRQTRDYLDNLINYANAPIIVWDPQYRITRFNHAFERLTGYKTDEVLGKNLEILFPDNKRDESMSLIRRTTSGERWEVVEISITHVDGTVKTVLWNSATLFAADGTTVVATIAQGQDITVRKLLELELNKYMAQLELKVDERTAELVAANQQLNQEVEYRRKAEEAVRNSEERFRTSVENMLDCFGIYSAVRSEQGEIVDFVVEYVNHATCLNNGLTKEEQVGRRLLEIQPKQKEFGSFKEYCELVETGRPIIKESQEYDGSLSNFIVGAYEFRAVKLGDGFAITWRNITERKRIEKELQQKAQLMELAHDAIIVRDIESRIIYWNKGAENLYGWLKEEALGQVTFSLLNTQFPKSLESTQEMFLHSGCWAGELIHGTRDGGKVVVSSRWVLQRNEQAEPIAIYEINRDITKSKQAEECFYKAFHLSPALMSIIRVEDGSFIDVNDAWLNTLGFTREEVIGRTPAEINLWSAAAKSVGEFNRLKGKKLSSIEVDINARDGEILSLLSTNEKITINGKPCLLSTDIDITEYRRMEKEMARLDQLNLVGEMAASIGHEIRNPMTTIRGFLQMMNERDNNKSNREYYELMIEELDRANAIITDYLSMAKDKAVELHPRYLNSIVKVLFPMIQADANYKEMQVRLDLDSPPKLLLDEKEIRQLIMNLARNGLEAMEPGGILTISTRVENGEAMLEVEDQGKGIPPEILERLGTPFQTTKVNGTGLGLAVCYSIAHRHNAKIEVETRPGGTIFSVRFRADH